MPAGRVYFGYGSNLWRDQMDRRCPQNKYVGVGILKDWRWIISTRGYANIVPSNGDLVYGLLYELTEGDEKILDRYEGVPIAYEKRILAVERVGNVGEFIDTLVYVNASLTEESRPKTEYIHRMNQGIRDAIAEGVPEEYIDKYLRPFIPRE